jgi:hypothetical protein
VESPSELTWRRVRRALDEFEMAATLLGFVNETYGPATGRRQLELPGDDN